MIEITSFIDLVSNIGLMGLLTILAFPKTRKWVGFENGKSKEIAEIKADILNIKENHLFHIETNIALIQKDIEYLKNK